MSARLLSVPSFTKTDALCWLAFSLIAAAVLISYYPSLYYPPRGDQVVYLADTSTRQNSFDLIFGCYDLTRNRIFAPGDEVLFRPLLYAVLGIQQIIFGHRFWAWQLFALFAHLVLTWMLLKFLWRLSGGWLAFAGTWLFALSWTQYELATWPHLSSYVLMTALLIAALEQVLSCFEEHDLPWHRIIKITVIFFIVCFIYESTNIFALWTMVFLILSCPRLWRRAFIVSIPVIFYVAASMYNFFVVNHLTLASSPQPFLLRSFVTNLFHLPLWWAYVGTFNGLYENVLLTSRTIFAEGDVLVFKPLTGNNLFIPLGIILCGSFLGLVISCRQRPRPQVWLFLLTIGLIFIYIGVILLGRYHKVEFWNIVRINTHYQYIFWVLMTIAGFLLIGKKDPLGTRRLFVAVFVAVSLISGTLQGVRIFNQAKAYSDATQGQVFIVTLLDLLIKQKGHEPGFSFYVHPDYLGNYVAGSVFVRPGTTPISEFTFVNLLYVPYVQPVEKAKYKFLVRPPASGKPSGVQ